MIIVILIRVVLVKKDALDYENERNQFSLNHEYTENSVIIPISDTAVAYLPENFSHRNFMRKKKVSSLLSYNPLAFKFVTEDKDRWNVATLKFYGKLIDQFQNPIPNVNLGIIILYSRGVSTFFGGSSGSEYPVYVKTDENGFFSLDQVVGKEFSIVVVSANGYFFKQYLYSRNIVNQAVTTKQNPFIIKGWKIENPTTLRKVEAKSLIFPKKVTPQNDGRPYTAFLNSKSDNKFVKGSNRDITVSVTSNNDGEIPSEEIRTTYTIEINKGGLIEVEDSDFPYKAPEVGYQPRIDESFKSKHLNDYRGRSGLSTSDEKYFYIKLDNPEQYGLLHFFIEPDLRGKLYYSLHIRLNGLGTRELLRESDLEFMKSKKHFTYKGYYFDFNLSAL